MSKKIEERIERSKRKLFILSNALEYMDEDAQNEWLVTLDYTLKALVELVEEEKDEQHSKDLEDLEKANGGIPFDPSLI